MNETSSIPYQSSHSQSRPINLQNPSQRTARPGHLYEHEYVSTMAYPRSIIKDLGSQPTWTVRRLDPPLADAIATGSPFRTGVQPTRLTWQSREKSALVPEE